MVAASSCAIVLLMLAKAESAGAVCTTVISVQSHVIESSDKHVPKIVRRGVWLSISGICGETAERAPVRAVRFAPERVAVRFMGGMITSFTM